MKKTFKKALAILLALMMLASVASVAFATTDIASGTAGEGVTWVIDASGTLTISGNGKIVVEWYNPPWYAYNGSILNIVVEEGIKDIPGSVFCYADKCVSVTIPASVTKINALAFTDMGSLKEIKLAESNPNYKIVDGVLFSKDGKTLVYFPNNLGVTEYAVPETVETIEKDAFYTNVCIKKVTIPDSVTFLGNSIFTYSDVESVILGNGITEISESCLSGTDIKSFVVPNSVKTINNASFWDCYYLETFVIGSGVETIEKNVVAYTDNLAVVHYNGTQEDWDAITIDPDNADLNEKELHFVEYKEGVEPTCKDGNTAGLYCADCDKYFTGEVIPAVKEHIFVDGKCSCGTICEHSEAEYVQTADTHQLNCKICGKTEAAEPHNIEYYEDDGNGKCTPYCYDCGYVDILSKYHVMTEYAWYDDEYCINYCANCGYGNEETGLVKHSYKSVDIPETEKEAAYTKFLCDRCENVTKEYKTGESIFFKLYSEYEVSWRDGAVLVYVNGEPFTLVRNMNSSEYDTFAIPYDKNSSYVFKWIREGDLDNEFGVEIYLPDSDNPVFEKVDMSGYEMLQTIYTINVADYSDVDAALATIPDYLEYYSAESVANLVTAVKGVRRMLPKGKQADVDAMAKAIETAVDGLVEIADPVPNGVINMSAGNYIYINDDSYSADPGYTYYNAETDDETTYEYDGKYVIIETEPKDEGSEDYVHYGIYTCFGDIEVDLVNTYITGYSGNLAIRNSASVTLNLFGANAFADYGDSGYAGIELESDSKLHINESDGSLIAFGDIDSAGIGSYSETDSGEIIIDGGTIFALSESDGAGIGGGYEGGAGKITINGGKIWAECMDDDGSGIGVGDDGEGGEIIINGGDITALSLDDDGAGIGGADNGYVDSITINGGKIVAGSDDGAAIGGGSDEDSCGGKIIINGGYISASDWHDNDENLIGNGSSDSIGETEYNFVQINGGVIDSTGADDIYPEPKDKSGNPVKKTTVTIHENLLGKEIILEFSDGTEYTVIAEGTEISLYLSNNVTVENTEDLSSGYCEHMCHQGGIMGFFWKIVNFFSKLFKTNSVCECGMSHY